MAAVTVKFPDADSLLVAYSGGKDSLVVLDLCVRSGRRVEAFFMYFLPGMDYTSYWTDFARKRWGVTVREYQHWNTAYYLRKGVFRTAPSDVPAITITDVETRVRRDSGIRWIGYGYKSVDSLHRRGMMNQWEEGIFPNRGVFAPIKSWNNNEVKAYLSRHRIPIPGLNTRQSNGIGLEPECFEWLRREWPADYRRILKVFPLAEAQADRAAKIRANENARPKVRVPRNTAKPDQAGAVQSSSD